MTKYTFDPRWEAIAREWLSDANVPDKLIDKYWRRLAQALQDAAEDEPNEIAESERQADEAAYDAHIQRQIDEMRGK